MTSSLFQPGLDGRRLRGELMDDPALAPAEHHRALRGLRRINAVSATSAQLWRALQPWVDRSVQRLHVLDIACGGGDVVVGLMRRARRRGVPLEVTACDISAVALDHARRSAERAGLTLALRRCDVLRDPLPTADLAICTLFLHHLEDEQVIAVLRAMAAAAPRVLVSDLERSRLGYAAAWVGTRLLSRSPIVHTDGPRSVEAAFAVQELRQLAEQAGLRSPTVQPHFPGRLLLKWERR